MDDLRQLFEMTNPGRVWAFILGLTFFFVAIGPAVTSKGDSFPGWVGCLFSIVWFLGSVVVGFGLIVKWNMPPIGDAEIKRWELDKDYRWEIEREARTKRTDVYTVRVRREKDGIRQTTNSLIWYGIGLICIPIGAPAAIIVGISGSSFATFCQHQIWQFEWQLGRLNKSQLPHTKRLPEDAQWSGVGAGFARAWWAFSRRLDL